MNWKQKTVIRILLIIADWLCEDKGIKEEITALANHISYGDREI